MLLVIALFVLLLALDVLALRWGYDSRDGFTSKEWERRAQFIV